MLRPRTAIKGHTASPGARQGLRTPHQSFYERFQYPPPPLMISELADRTEDQVGEA
jgi:hypothetical protein